MSQNVSDKSAAFPRLLPSFSFHQAVRQFWMKYPAVWEHFLQLPISIQQELLDFCIGKSGLRITYPDNAGLHEDIFICLDIFHSIVHTISKRSTLQEAWLTFFSATDIDNIAALVRAFPMFLPIYQEITDFAQNPKELMNMLSEALYIMDRNMERQMVAEMRQEMQQKIQQEVQRRVEQEVQQRIEQEVQQRVQQEVQQRVQKEANAIADAAKTEANIFRLRLLGRSPEEIAEKLAISVDKVNDVLASLTAP